MSLFKNRPAADFEVRVLECKKVTIVQIQLNPCPLSQPRHTSFQPPLSLRRYNVTVISDILDEGDNVCLLNINKMITSYYFILFDYRLEQPPSKYFV